MQQFVMLTMLRDQVTEVKTELTTLRASLLSSDDPITQEQDRTEKADFGCLFRIKKRLFVLNAATTKPSD